MAYVGDVFDAGMGIMDELDAGGGAQTADFFYLCQMPFKENNAFFLEKRRFHRKKTMLSSKLNTISRKVLSEHPKISALESRAGANDNIAR